ncbi:MAG: LytTR family DNA-binding domain-containing protein [Clostridiales bacterium]|nr:LytTR family DNA-binding domain-containing protein [Clostridiales bacterium]
MRIMVCDDDSAHCDIIERLIYANLDEAFESDVLKFYSAGDLVEFCKNNVPDILFLDIELGDMNGINLAKNLKEKFPNIIIVYVSSHPKYVFACFETEPLNFLKKPPDKDEFAKTFSRVIKKYLQIHKTFPVKWHNELNNLEIKDICYVEGYNRHLQFHLYNGDSYKAVGRIDEIYKELRLYGFVKTHQGFIVNMQHIKSFGENEIYMKNGDTVLMSVRRRLKAKEIYAGYINGGIFYDY